MLIITLLLIFTQYPSQIHTLPLEVDLYNILRPFRSCAIHVHMYTFIPLPEYRHLSAVDFTELSFTNPMDIPIAVNNHLAAMESNTMTTLHKILSYRVLKYHGNGNHSITLKAQIETKIIKWFKLIQLPCTLTLHLVPRLLITGLKVFLTPYLNFKPNSDYQTEDLKMPAIFQKMFGDKAELLYFSITGSEDLSRLPQNDKFVAVVTTEWNTALSYLTKDADEWLAEETKNWRDWNSGQKSLHRDVDEWLKGLMDMESRKLNGEIRLVTMLKANRVTDINAIVKKYTIQTIESVSLVTKSAINLPLNQMKSSEHIRITIESQFQISNTGGCFVTIDTKKYSHNVLKNKLAKMENLLEKQRIDRKAAPYTSFENWMISDPIVAGLVFRNCVITSYLPSQKALSKNMHKMGRIVVDSDEKGSYAYLQDTHLKYITCDGISDGKLSILGYFSAFDKFIWIALLGMVLCSAGFLVAFVNFMSDDLANKINLWLPISILFEQGANDQTNSYSYSMLLISWTTMGLVISNAYKGQNITDLSAAIPPVPMKHFNELIDKKFYIYSKVDHVNSILNIFHSFNLFVLFPKNFGSWETDISSMSALTNYLEKPRKHKKRLSGLISRTYNFTDGELVHNVSVEGFPHGYLNYILSCDRSAFVAWSDEIQMSKVVLKRMLLNGGVDRNHKLKSVVVSEEALSRKRKAWHLHSIEFPGSYIFRRISAMVESGIARQWNEWESRVKWYCDLKIVQNWEENSRGPKSLGMGDNIVVIFYGHLIFLAVGTISFLYEKVKLVLLTSDGLTSVFNRITARMSFGTKVIVINQNIH